MSKQIGNWSRFATVSVSKVLGITLGASERSTVEALGA